MSSDVDALGAAVRATRQRLGLTIEEVATRAGLSPVTWGRVEKGELARGLTYAAVERALGWPLGAAQQLLTGAATADAIPSTNGEDPLIVGIWADPNLSEDQRMQLERIVRQSNADREMVEERLRRSGRQIG